MKVEISPGIEILYCAYVSWVVRI